MHIKLTESRYQSLCQDKAGQKNQNNTLHREYEFHFKSTSSTIA